MGIVVSLESAVLQSDDQLREFFDFVGVLGHLSVIECEALVLCLKCDQFLLVISDRHKSFLLFCDGILKPPFAFLHFFLQLGYLDV